MSLLIVVATIIAAAGFGVHAIRRWRGEGRPVAAGLGVLWSARSVLDLGAGLLISGIVMAAVFWTEHAVGAIQIMPSGAGAAPIGALARLSVIAFEEEFIMRSLLLSGLILALRGRAALAIGISAALFGMSHLSNPHASSLAILGNTLGGIVYGVAFVRSGGIWLPLGLHLSWNFVQGPILGFTVSGMDQGGFQTITTTGPDWLTGGAYGPEAGVVGIASRFLVITSVLVWLRVNRGARSAELHQSLDVRSDCADGSP
ncbi:MAG TPA: CPBP family intramembrane glutamic endopeptidase [Allosphingosinicella sp.]|jgi:membrane protease YdiL (CAAX protease family)|nr:CPBP family intramembrane glutamic endopeptidase [Allosphingosinicella sp.]